MIKKILGIGFAAVLALGATISTADALQRYQLRIINQASSPIVSVYVRNLATDVVSGDILGSGIIDVGSTRIVRLEDGDGTCNWRVQTDLVDGRTVKKDLDVCRTVSLTIND